MGLLRAPHFWFNPSKSLFRANKNLHGLHWFTLVYIRLPPDAVEPVVPIIKADGEETLVSPFIHKSCVSLIDIVSLVDGRQQQQEQSAGSIGVKALSPKHTL